MTRSCSNLSGASGSQIGISEHKSNTGLFLSQNCVWAASKVIIDKSISSCWSNRLPASMVHPFCCAWSTKNFSAYPGRLYIVQKDWSFSARLYKSFLLNETRSKIVRCFQNLPFVQLCNLVNIPKFVYFSLSLPPFYFWLRFTNL